MTKQIPISKQRYPYATQQCPYKSSFRRRTEGEGFTEREKLSLLYPEMFKWELPAEWRDDISAELKKLSDAGYIELITELFKLIEDSFKVVTLK